MNTIDRLQTMGPSFFTDDVLEKVARAAAVQNSQNFRHIATELGVESGPDSIDAGGFKSSIEVLQLLPPRTTDYDEKTARVYNGGLGAPLDPIRSMHHFRLFGADNTVQYFAFGTPAMATGKTGKLAAPNALRLARDVDWTPFARAQLAYLAGRGITRLELLAYSGGNEKALSIAQLAEEYGMTARAVVLAAPVSGESHGLGEFVSSFMRTGAEQKRYYTQTESNPYLALWAKDSKKDFANWVGGLLRVTNIAMAVALTKGRFFGSLASALDAQSQLKASVIWGSFDEMSTTECLRDGVDAVARTHLGRIYGTELPVHHAAGDDIDFHAAIMLQGLRKAAS